MRRGQQQQQQRERQMGELQRRKKEQDEAFAAWVREKDNISRARKREACTTGVGFFDASPWDVRFSTRACATDTHTHTHRFERLEYPILGSYCSWYLVRFVLAGVPHKRSTYSSYLKTCPWQTDIFIAHSAWCIHSSYNPWTSFIFSLCGNPTTVSSESSATFYPVRVALAPPRPPRPIASANCHSSMVQKRRAMTAGGSNTIDAINKQISGAKCAMPDR